jgi:hypothetical protein
LASAFALGTVAVLWLLGISAALATSYVVERYLGKLPSRIVVSAIFGLIPAAVANFLRTSIAPIPSIIAWLLLFSAQLSWSLYDDAGDRVKAGNQPAGRRYLIASAIVFASSIAAGFGLLTINNGLAWGFLAIVAASICLPFIAGFWSEQRYYRAANRRHALEPALELRWSDGRSWRIPVWTAPPGFPIYIFVILAFASPHVR